MDSIGKKETSVEVSAIPTPPERARLELPKASMDNVSLPSSQCPTPSEEYDPNNTSPFSPFYSHPTTTASFEQLKAGSTSNFQGSETDLESGSKRFSCEQTKNDCRLWPKRSFILREKQQHKKKRGCYPWNTLSKKQKLAVQLAIVLLVCGLVVGVAVGISKAVGGTFYAGRNNHNVQVGN